MKFLLLVGALCLVFSGCSVNAQKLDKEYVQKFASQVRCSKGYKGKCWCFVASRQTGKTDSTGIGMCIVPDELCK